MGTTSIQGSTKSQNRKEVPFVLFGQEIHTAKQISVTCSSETVSTRHTVNSSDESGFFPNRNDARERSSSKWFQSELNIEPDHCKVFMESEDVGRTLNLSLLGSYEELHMKLASMFRVEIAEIAKHIHYLDDTGSVRQLGEEPFR